jgi:predicted membrane channel-forming protein YqfA (hemolysin III family)
MLYPVATSTWAERSPRRDGDLRGAGARCGLSAPVKEEEMKLNAPKQITFLISVVLVLIAVLVVLGIVPSLPVSAFWLAIVGYVLLALGCLLPNL